MTTYNLRHYSLISILLSFFITTSLLAQQPITAELDKIEMYIGDHIQLNLKIHNAEGISNPKTDLSPIQAVENIEMLETRPWDTIMVNGDIFYEQKILLTSFDSGYYYVPSLDIKYEKAGRRIVKTTNRLAFTVNTVQTDPAQVAPIRDIIEEPLRLEDFIWLIALILGIVLLIALYYFYYKNKKAAAAPPIPEVILPPHEIALSQLTELKAAKLWQKGEIKSYQSKLTHIVREYLEGRYDIQALESTTDQILSAMKKNGIESDHRDKLQEMFTMADLVKFAKAKPPVDANEKLMEYAEKFILSTKQNIIEEAAETETNTDTSSDSETHTAKD